MPGGCSGRLRAKDVDSRPTNSSQTSSRTGHSQVTPVRKDYPKGAKIDVRNIDDHLSKCFQSSVTFSGPSNRSCPVFPDVIKFSAKSLKEQESSNQQNVLKKSSAKAKVSSKGLKEQGSSDQQNVSKKSSAKASKVSAKSLTEQGSSDQQNVLKKSSGKASKVSAKSLKEQESSDQKNVLKNSSGKASEVSSRDKKARKTNAWDQNEKPIPAQQKTPALSNDNTELPSKKSQVRNSSSPKKSSQAIKRSSIKKKSVPSEVGHEKVKSKHPVSESKPLSRRVKNYPKCQEICSDPSSPTYFITSDGTAKVFEESFGARCPLCNMYLSSLPSNDDLYSYYEDIDEPSNFPDLAVLSCGHVFHNECLINVTPDEQSRDPPCFLCLSCIL